MAVVRGLGGRFIKAVQKKVMAPVRMDYSFDEEKKPEKNLMEKAAPVMVVLLIIMSFALGSLWTKVNMLENGSGTGTKINPTPTAAQQQGQQQPAQTAVTISTIKGLFSKSVIKFGDANKKVLFVEVADPSCPYCSAAAGDNPTLNKQIGTQFVLVADGGTYISPVKEMRKLVDSGKAGMVYIYSPGHGNGEMGMKALYCADEKGVFWQAQDILMSDAGYSMMNNDVKNDKTKSDTVAQLLKSVVDPDFLKSCLDSGKYDSRLADDTALAITLGVKGTPAFYVNSQLFPGAYSWKDMQSAVDTALK